ncbi:MAG: GNAT family N-acetyltransferase [Proteobacteria bacterium]|nr:GNAT family N-acetyltransferase [Pseudomonadota bacterium]
MADPLIPVPDLHSAAQPAAAATISVRAAPWTGFDNSAFHARWQSLAARASEPNPFHEEWYLLPALRALDPEGTVQLLTVEQDGKLVGLLPLRHESRYYGRPIPQLRAWVHGNCFLAAPLVAAGQEPAFWRALLDWADRHARAALFLHLGPVALDGALHTALSAVLDQDSRHAALVMREDRAMLAANETPAAYFEASLSGKKRKELRRQHARLSELGNLRFERQTDAEGLADWTEKFLTLEHSGWKGTAGSALASHHGTATLFRQALAGAAAQGKLERMTLWLDDEPVAMLVQFITQPGAYSFKTAFDERFARFSPGVLLQRENLDLLARPDVQWCDSCAAADHPMIDHLWRERRATGRLSIAIGGPLRRALFGLLARIETRRRRG